MSLIQNLVLLKPGSSKPFIVPEPMSGEPHSYFIGYPSWAFQSFAPRIYHALGRCVSVVVGDSYVNDRSHMTINKHPVPIITLSEFASQAQKSSVEEINFSKVTTLRFHHAYSS
jgi:hypothetical protein